MFPKYISLGSLGHTCLRLLRAYNDTAIYQRPPESGNWTCEVKLVNGVLKITDCAGEHLIGVSAHECSFDKFNEDNGFIFNK